MADELTAAPAPVQLTWDESCDLGAEWHDQTIPPFHQDLCGQRATAEQISHMTDIPLTGSYL
ncbi:hypothetical protein [Streptomyces sp. NPDC088794]|uniref:hypothetical protein n=1 Tax=Streptomyces sp. NPDC088794 TaxID=3365902 RepID=UPI003817EAE9